MTWIARYVGNIILTTKIVAKTSSEHGSVTFTRNYHGCSRNYHDRPTNQQTNRPTDKPSYGQHTRFYGQVHVYAAFVSLARVFTCVSRL